MQMKEGSFLAFFFTVFCLSQNICSALTNNPDMSAKLSHISQSSTWHALLHWNGKKSYINNERFLLSYNNFSPENELIATLNYFHSEAPYPQCRFPARYAYLQMHFSLPELSTDKCAALSEFQKKAPIDRIALIFASENISMPSSMMGHIFIKISGTNYQGYEVDHAISFFTDINGFNIPKIIYDSMIIGKEGHLALTPYQELLTRYNELEQRNVWEYTLKMDGLARKLIHLHFFELKQTELTYYFSNYNCATFTKFVLAIAINTKQENTHWDTPVDVVRYAEKNGLIEHTSLSSATRWCMRMLGDTLDPITKQKIKAAVINQDIEKIAMADTEEKVFISLELASGFNELRKMSGAITSSTYDEIQQEISTFKKDITPHDLDL